MAQPRPLFVPRESIRGQRAGYQMSRDFHPALLIKPTNQPTNSSRQSTKVPLGGYTFFTGDRYDVKHCELTDKPCLNEFTPFAMLQSTSLDRTFMVESIKTSVVLTASFSAAEVFCFL